jgi:hypothetical protein
MLFLSTNGFAERFGFGGGANYSTYSQAIVIQPYWLE